MGSLALDDLRLAEPIPYRSAAHPDGIDLNTLLIPSPLTTFFMRVRGHRLGDWGVRDGDLLMIDRAIDPRPGHLLVVAYGGRFLLRPLVVEGGRWQLASLGRAEAAIPLEGLETATSDLFGVAVQAVHHLLKRPDAAAPPRQTRGRWQRSPLRSWQGDRPDQAP
jgi:DNA polymerase V